MSNKIENAEKKRWNGKFGEWARKKVVGLKRKPETIPLIVLLITSVYFLFILFSISQCLDIKGSQMMTNIGKPNQKYLSAGGICTFASTLLSILVLVTFLNAFPKREDPKLAFIILVYVMIAGILACDLVYYLQVNNLLIHDDTIIDEQGYLLESTQLKVMVHMILLVVSTVMFALYPVWKKLIRSIDTSIVLESTSENMQGEIDIQED